MTEPGSPEWAVAFAIPGLRRCVDDVDVVAMFGLDPSEVADISAVVLSSAGRLVCRHGVTADPGVGSVSVGLAACLEEITTDGADCVGVAETGRDGPVAMCARAAPGAGGSAEAAFSAPPEGIDALRPMLAAIGVRPTKVRKIGSLVHVEFAVDLRRHIESARLAHFGRTLTCVEFFRDGAGRSATVRRGLRLALEARLLRGAERVRERAVSLVRSGRPLTMTARTQSGPGGRSYGDVVPAGVLLAGLRVLAGRGAGEQIGACAALRERLIEARAAAGWAFQRETLPTATDSALVLLGLGGRTEVADLERYADGSGGYLPQLSAEVSDPGHMRRTAATAHWEQPDLFTTCLVRHLRRQAGLATTTPTAWISDRFARRSGLFTASPWLVDMAVALAIESEPEAEAMRVALRRELFAARNEDGSFGRPSERPLATAAAICALRALGVQGRLLGESQLRLTESLEEDRVGVGQVPFASTTIVARPQGPGVVRGLLRGDCALIVSAGRPLALTVYEDTAGAVTLGLATLALSRLAQVGEDDTTLLDGLPARSDRYARADTADYVALDGMPPYVAHLTSGTPADL